MTDPSVTPVSETWPIERLQPWDKNPRTITDKDFDRLKAQIKRLGVYKPLLVTPNGIVLGGNMRFRALQELGHKEAWVSVVQADDEATMLEYALSDNDAAGSYDKEALAELASLHPVELGLFKVELAEAVPIEALVDEAGPSANENLVPCPTCGHKVNPERLEGAA